MIHFHPSWIKLNIKYKSSDLQNRQIIILNSILGQHTYCKQMGFSTKPWPLTNSLGWQTFQEYVLFSHLFLSLLFTISACLSFCFHSHMTLLFSFSIFFWAFPGPPLVHSYAFFVYVYHVYMVLSFGTGVGKKCHSQIVLTTTRLEGSVIANLTFSCHRLYLMHNSP